MRAILEQQQRMKYIFTIIRWSISLINCAHSERMDCRKKSEKQINNLPPQTQRRRRRIERVCSGRVKSKQSSQTSA